MGRLPVFFPAARDAVTLSTAWATLVAPPRYPVVILST